jgi:hypothetical protein
MQERLNPALRELTTARNNRFLVFCFVLQYWGLKSSITWTTTPPQLMSNDF